MQTNPFPLVEELQLMIASLLKKTESLKTTRKKTTEVFGNYYINVAEITSGKQPSSIGNPNSQCKHKATV